MRFAVLLLSLAVMFSGCSKKVVGYKTETVFIPDSGDVNGWTERGWEVKSARRARKVLSTQDLWGTEYVLQKPIYR